MNTTLKMTTLRTDIEDDPKLRICIHDQVEVDSLNWN